MKASRPRTRRIGLLLYPGCMPAGLLSTADLLRAVNRRSGREVFEVTWLGLTRRPLTTEDGLTLRPRQTLAESRCEVCLVPGFWTESEDDVDAMLERQAELIAALRKAPGAPALCSAGAQGHLLLVSEQLSQWIAPEVMRDVQHLLMLPRPPAAHPAFRPVELMAQPSPELRRLLVYAQSVPASQLSLAHAAKHCALSPRTLCRRIEALTGLSAGAWLRMVKLRQVSDALSTSTAPLKVIAEELGYLDESSLHRSFRKVTGMTPVRYRQLFGEVRLSQLAG